ncbi:MAG: M48 family metallopeptidase [Marinobacter sp.]|uniref:M48 family metallopeptidase n=1 Tax=Marinobacter sp. TaxID=50741 RepID=UPI00299F0202|nr:M48 family metallopeptidase [Marinobacter sp.]MDX1635236.1 M48 family metallopeptidase [Marinobacter sp.]
MRTILLLLLLLVPLGGCDETPTGRSQLALVPDSVMQDLGQQAFAEIKQRQPVVTLPEPNRLVRCVAQAVIAAAASHYPQVPMPESWEVAVFEDPSPNAFALPGGKIGLHTGMLTIADTPSQLAAIVGHEVAHVLAEHGNERLTQELGIEAALYVVGLFSEGELGQEQLMQAQGLGAELGIALPFSRAHEEEADVMGLMLMAVAGFDPRQAVTLWQTMAARGGEQPMEFLSTHPAHESRIERLQEHMDQALALAQGRPDPCRR